MGGAGLGCHFPSTAEQSVCPVELHSQVNKLKTVRVQSVFMRLFMPGLGLLGLGHCWLLVE